MLSKSKTSKMYLSTTQTFIALLLVLSLMIILPPKMYASPHVDTPPGHGVPEECLKFNHHKMSRWFNLIFQGKVWANPDTGDVIAAVYVAECGRWLMSVWRGWNWRTHFFPKAKQSASKGYQYIMQQVQNAGAREFSWRDFNIRGAWLFLIVPPDICELTKTCTKNF